ncbi:MAG: inorganic pyrophosphatase [Gammaproteobacteria bacterium]|nr:inorganic pyrophosphatase [Gammaproteobacteria bacterium]
MSKLLRPHPWHGLELYDNREERILNAYIEIVPSDTVKYELEKKTGYLKVDRPQRFSNIIPALYGFLPKTYCGQRVAAFSVERLGRNNLQGDSDPLDICVLTEKNVIHGDLIVNAIPIGGFRMIDHGEVDDKIIAVLKDDAVFSDMRDIKNCPDGTLSRLRHYFLTYKQIPDPDTNEIPKCEITHIYGHEEAIKVIDHAEADYHHKYTFNRLEDSV